MGRRRILSKLRAALMRRRSDQELNREIASHLRLLEDEFERRGMPPEEARLAARRAYGGVEQTKQLYRDERSFVGLEQAFEDLRHAWRSLSKDPLFTAIAVLSLAFGIGVNTAIFTLLNGVLLKTLPVPHPHRIVQINAGIGRSFVSDSFSFPVFRELRRQAAIFEDVIGFSPESGIVEQNGETRRVDLEIVTGNYFRFFGALPVAGRLLTEQDDQVGGRSRVCVIAEEMWQRDFGGDARVVGRPIVINGMPLLVVGVAPANFVGAELQNRYEVWVPSAVAQDFTHNPRESVFFVWIETLARLRPGVTFAQANTRLQAASRPLEAGLPKGRANADALYSIQDARAGFDSWRSHLRAPLVLLMGAVSLVLLVACANLANLLLARATERQHEFAIKLSLGISRWRLLRQNLVETSLLAFAGGCAAILLSRWTTRFLLGFYAERRENLHVEPDLRVLLFTFGVCVFTACIAGFYPAWQASRTDPGTGLKGGSSRSTSRGLVRRALIVVQVTLALVLLFGASLFTHSLARLKTVDLGFDIHRVLTVEIGQRGRPRLAGSNVVPASLHSILDRVRQLPPVESAAFSIPGVLGLGQMSGDISFQGEGRRSFDNIYFLDASPGYFATMRIPLLKGRDFTASDVPSSQIVAIVNQRLASLAWPGQDPIGKTFDGWAQKGIQVIGIVGNSRYQSVREELHPIVYLAFDQLAGAEGGALEIRFHGSAAPLESAVREIVKSSAPDYQVSNTSTLELLRDRTLAQDRLLTFLSSLFGALGAALALAGIYGVVSYSVTRRTREIGIRISVGAQRSDVLRLFVGESMLLVSLGALIGLPLALILASFAKKMLFEISTADPLGVAATVLLLALGGLLAAYLPGRRATRIDPVQALRWE